MTKSDLRTAVSNLCGNHSQLTDPVVNNFLETENWQIIESWDWSRRYTYAIVNLVAPVTAGTVATTPGSAAVVGTGTAFTASMIGRFIRIAGKDAFHKIIAVADATDLTIEQPWVEEVNAAASYSIFQNIYGVASDAEKIITPLRSRSIYLVEKTRNFIDRIDPSRTSTAADPEAFCYADRDPNGVLQVEFWPVPIDAHPVPIRYQRVVALTNDTDSPLYRPDVLKWKAAQDAALFLFAKTGDQTWMTLGASYATFYKDSYDSAVLDDMDKISKARQVRPEDRDLGLSDDFLARHDIFMP